jgi:hypothetical protein
MSINGTVPHRVRTAPVASRHLKADTTAEGIESTAARGFSIRTQLGNGTPVLLWQRYPFGFFRRYCWW